MYLCYIIAFFFPQRQDRFLAKGEICRLSGAELLAQRKGSAALEAFCWRIFDCKAEAHAARLQDRPGDWADRFHPCPIPAYRQKKWAPKGGPSLIFNCLFPGSILQSELQRIHHVAAFGRLPPDNLRRKFHPAHGTFGFTLEDAVGAIGLHIVRAAPRVHVEADVA